jgi:hypothetical protein
MTMHHSCTVRPAISRDEAAVLALVPRLRAFEQSSSTQSSSTLRSPEALDAGEQRTLRSAYRADFVRYVKPLN